MLGYRPRRRYVRLFLAALILWCLSANLPSFFFRLSVLVDHNAGGDNSADDMMAIAPLQEEEFHQYVSRKALGEHIFREDGLLEVNPDAPHPIFQLVKRAEKEWNEKIKKASSSLEEAVREYRRRYRRSPPKGFDQWWEYVKLHDILLPDEYDQIYHDLEPFWGIDPFYLQQVQAEMEDKKDSYTIGKTDKSKIQVVKTAFEEGRYDQLIYNSKAIIEHLRDIEEFLPPFRATFSPHDGPNRLSDYVVKSTALEAASVQSYLYRSSHPKVHSLGWRSACSPDSPARKIHINLDAPAPPRVKKFLIHDHHKAMDPCQHPNLFWHHGQFLSHNMGPGPQHTMVPEFASCSTAVHHNIRFPTPYGWVEDILPRSNDPEWDDKIEERLLWRGTNTGIFHASHTRWRASHRDALVQYANEINGTIEYLAPPLPGYEDVAVGEPKKAKRARVNPALMDIAFAGRPTQCDEKTCKIMEDMYDFKKMQSLKAQGNYKYVLDVDGNGWSGRFKRLITSNSLVFKSTIYPEWFSDRIAPWVHYVPVQVDLSDLYDTLIFFRGDANGDGAHEDLARKIAKQGRDWSKAFWRREDIVAYFYRLILEYARVMSLDREEMTYHGDGAEVFDWHAMD